MKKIDNQFFQDQIRLREIKRAMYEQQMDNALNPPQQQGGGGMPGGMNIAKQFMGGGAGGGAAASSGGTVAGAGSGAIVGTPMSAYEGYGALEGGSAASNAAPMAGPLAIGAGLFAGNEYLQGKMGDRDDAKDYAKVFLNPYSDTYNYMEEGFGKLKGLFSDLF